MGQDQTLDCNTVDGVHTDIRCVDNLPLRPAGVGAATGPDPNVVAAEAAQASSQTSIAGTTLPSPSVASGAPVVTSLPTALVVAAGPTATPTPPSNLSQAPLPSDANLIAAVGTLVAPSAATPAPATSLQGVAPATLTAGQVPVLTGAALQGAVELLVAPAAGPAAAGPIPALVPIAPGRVINIPPSAPAPGPQPVLIRVGAGAALDPTQALADLLSSVTNPTLPGSP